MGAHLGPRPTGNNPYAIPRDPFFNAVSLLLHGDGTNGAQNNTFLDSSTNNFTVTRNGNTTQGTNTPFSQPAGAWSNYFDGTGDFLNAPANAAFNFGTGDWTVECWFHLTENATAMSNGNRLACLFSISSQVEVITMQLSVNGNTTTTGTGFELYKNQNTEVSMVRNITINKSTWYHAAVSKSGTTIRIFLNGAQVGASQTDSTSWGSSSINPFVGRLSPSAGWAADFPGYISNLRVVKGTAVYTSDFTPSTTPLTAITNTSLLTCQSNFFKDHSSNNFALTTAGTPSVQPFSPFAPTSAYSTSVNGGSMYFDGTGDYLIASNTMSALTGNFTIECWIYCPITTDTIVASSEGGSNFQIFRINQGVVGNISVYWNTNADLFGFSTKHINVNTWNHLAMTRVGTTAYLYVNGVQVASKAGVTDNTCKPNVVGSLWLNGSISTAIPRFNGYVSNYRVVNGTALYTANFTPPTTPLTAITNTSLLLSGTNAGIVDNASKNDLETVGNAQVSTSVKKYGTGSMSFDGTGDYLYIPLTPQYIFGAGNWTVEFWLYSSSLATAQTILNLNSENSGGYGTVRISLNTNGSMGLLCSPGGTWINTSTTSTGLITTGTWYHIAAVRNGSTFTLYIDGTSRLTYSSASALSNAGLFSFIGCDYSSNTPQAFYNGYIDDLRITKGVARYTANFTPPTAAFSDY